MKTNKEEKKNGSFIKVIDIDKIPLISDDEDNIDNIKEKQVSNKDLIKFKLEREKKQEQVEAFERIFEWLDKKDIHAVDPKEIEYKYFEKNKKNLSNDLENNKNSLLERRGKKKLNLNCQSKNQ